MAYLGETFNANDHEAWGQKDATQVIPEGRYLAQILASDVVNTKSGNGQRLIWTVVVLDGQHAGHKIYDSINTHNPSAKAVEVGRSRLSMVALSLGISKFDDSSELHGIPFWAHVGTKDDRNEVTYYEKREIEPGRPRPAPPTLPASNSAASLKPWDRRL